MLLDCPPQTLPHLFRLGAPARAIDLVLLSHAHSDHVGGMDLFLLEAMQGREAREGAPRERPLAVAGPPGLYERLRGIVGASERLPERGDPRLRWFAQAGGTAFAWAGWRVECEAMEHAPDLAALGFRVRAPGGPVVAYSGDTRWCEALLRLGEGADLLIAECGGSRAHGHLEWDDVRALREALAPATRILVTHYDPLAVPAWARTLDGLALAEDFAAYEA